MNTPPNINMDTIMEDTDNAVITEEPSKTRADMDNQRIAHRALLMVSKAPEIRQLYRHSVPFDEERQVGFSDEGAVLEDLKKE